METIESLRRKIDSTKDLQSIVKTMKALAAVSIRQYERAVESLADYTRTVEMGFQVLIMNRPEVLTRAQSAARNRLGLIVFGSDQGMCGQLNDRVADKAASIIDDAGVGEDDLAVLSVGERVNVRLEFSGMTTQDVFPVPGSIGGITPGVQDILFIIDEWTTHRGFDTITLVYSRPLSGASFRPVSVDLLPFDLEWLESLASKEWESHAIPQFTMDRNALFSSLVKEFLFILLYRAFADSLASENASRLAAMQAAERNIEDRINVLTSRYHQQRQKIITEELLDIVSGFEVLTGEDARTH